MTGVEPVLIIDKLCKKILRECLDDCGDECRELGLDSECYTAYRDCLGNPENYKHEV